MSFQYFTHSLYFFDLLPLGFKLALGLIPSSFKLIFGGIIGAIIGSFVNAMAFRRASSMRADNIKGIVMALNYFGYDAPKGIESEYQDNRKRGNRSACFGCGKKIPFYLNVPIFAWLLLRGKSNCCGSKIPMAYFLSEVVFAIVFSACFLYGESLSFLLYPIVFSILYYISIVDAKTKLIPDSPIYALIWIGVVYSVFIANTPFNIIVLIGIYFVFSILSLLPEMLFGKTIFGQGDTKLFCALAAFLGTSFPLLLVLSGVSFIAYYFIRKEKGEVPFGPAISIAGAVILFAKLVLDQDIVQMGIAYL